MKRKTDVEIAQYFIMPIAFKTAQSLTLPGGMQAPQFIQGAVRWSVKRGQPDSAAWRQTEYDMVERKVNVISMSVEGKRLADVAVEVASKVREVLPDRDISVMLGAFGVEYKHKEKDEAGVSDS